VAPKGLRQGVGTAIVRRLETIAREHGVDRLELHATTTAEPFYQHLGYVSEERMTHRSSTGVEMDAVFMTKELSPDAAVGHQNLSSNSRRKSAARFRRR
jgi:putative acetyltransferase